MIDSILIFPIEFFKIDSSFHELFISIFIFNFIEIKFNWFDFFFNYFITVFNFFKDSRFSNNFFTNFLHNGHNFSFFIFFRIDVDINFEVRILNMMNWYMNYCFLTILWFFFNEIKFNLSLVDANFASFIFDFIIFIKFRFYTHSNDSIFRINYFVVHCFSLYYCFISFFIVNFIIIVIFRFNWASYSSSIFDCYVFKFNFSLFECSFTIKSFYFIEFEFFWIKRTIDNLVFTVNFLFNFFKFDFLLNYFFLFVWNVFNFNEF